MKTTRSFICLLILLALCIHLTACVSVYEPDDFDDNTSETSITIPGKEDIMEKEANRILSEMTLNEKIGQLFIVRCVGETALTDISDYHIGGYTLYAVDFEDETPESFKSKIAAYQFTSKIPMFIATDEEGGSVVRASKYENFRNTPFASPAQVYADGGIDGLISNTEEKCDFLRALGLNLNYAPVCDLTNDPENYIYKRTIGQDAETSAAAIAAIVEEMNRKSFGCSLKHFPGYGDNSDTHTGMATDASRTAEDFRANDFLPFTAGIEAGAGMVMVAHVIINCFDDKYPASLSPAVHTILREELGFDGVIVTDSLDMNAITNFTNGSEATVAALLAGNDLLCCSNFKPQIAAIKNALDTGVLTEERINESVLRILKLKIELGIIG